MTRIKKPVSRAEKLLQRFNEHMGLDVYESPEDKIRMCIHKVMTGEHTKEEAIEHIAHILNTHDCTVGDVHNLDQAMTSDENMREGYGDLEYTHPHLKKTLLFTAGGLTGFLAHKYAAHHAAAHLLGKGLTSLGGTLSGV